MIQTDNALIVVDYQNSFVPENEWWTWELWVEWGWLLSARINELMRETKQKWGLIIATRDWHPEWHISFASNYQWKDPFNTVDWEEAMNNIPQELQLEDTAGFNKTDLQSELWATGKQVLWPNHCVKNTPWADFHKDLNTSLIDRYIIKWYAPTTEMYSWFFGKEQREDKKNIRLTDILKEAWVKTVTLVWLATDFCVQSTAVDAVKNWFKAIIDSSAVRWVAVTPENTIKFLETLREKEGVEYV